MRRRAATKNKLDLTGTEWRGAFLLIAARAYLHFPAQSSTARKQGFIASDHLDIFQAKLSFRPYEKSEEMAKLFRIGNAGRVSGEVCYDCYGLTVDSETLYNC
jgi:hypothetical protein